MTRIACWLLACALGCAAADQNEKENVVAAVNKLFQGMSAGDAEMVAASMTADAKLIAVQDDKVTTRSGADFAQRIGSAPKGSLLERIWEPTVLIRGGIAAVWAEYDFHSNGKFHHCGIDAFLLVKTGGEWKISSIEYTTETQGCKPSPLGPPQK
jgi:ketosteroid isomerase-like protein